MSVHTLKAILFSNHVNAGNILEKSELVAKVLSLVENERIEQARQRAIEEQEEEERIQQQREMMEEHERRQRERAEQEAEANARANAQAAPNDDDANGLNNAHSGSEAASHSVPTAPPPVPPAKAAPSPPRPTLERNGLCVICQDLEACIAIVDCGYVLSHPSSFSRHFSLFFSWRSITIFNFR